MLILRTREGTPSLDALSDEAGRPLEGIARIAIELGPKEARARIERRGAKKGELEAVEATVTRIAAWFVPDPPRLRTGDAEGREGSGHPKTGKDKGE